VSASYTEGQLTRPKSLKVRSVPMAPEVGSALARLGQRERWTGDDDLVFPGITGGYLDASALYRRFVAAARLAELRRLRFHDLRHTFGTTMAANPRVDVRRLQEWMVTRTSRRPCAMRTSRLGTTMRPWSPSPSPSGPWLHRLARDPLPEHLGIEQRSPPDLEEGDAAAARQLVDGRPRDAQHLGDLGGGQEARRAKRVVRHSLTGPSPGGGRGAYRAWLPRSRAAQ